jgi:hypothetical protein
VRGDLLSKWWMLCVCCVLWRCGDINKARDPEPPFFNSNNKMKALRKLYESKRTAFNTVKYCCGIFSSRNNIYNFFFDFHSLFSCQKRHVDVLYVTLSSWCPLYATCIGHSWNNNISSQITRALRSRNTGQPAALCSSLSAMLHA